MAPDLHRIVGLHLSPALARHARDLIIASGPASARIRVLTGRSMGAVAVAGAGTRADRNNVLKGLLLDASIGTAKGGMAAGASASIAMAAANLTPFIASRVLGAVYLDGGSTDAERHARGHFTRQLKGSSGAVRLPTVGRATSQHRGR